MESGYAFLHPRNAFLSAQEGFARDYAPIPFSPWRPCVPLVERHIPPIGFFAWLYRVLRLFWVLVTLPTWIGLVALMELAPLDEGTRSHVLGDAILPRRKSWTRWQRFIYPVLARTVWAVTFGLPPVASPVTDRGVPLLARLWYGRRTVIEPVNLAFSDVQEERRWVQDEARDESGKIVSQEYLAGFWIKADHRSSVAQASMNANGRKFYENGHFHAPSSTREVQVVLYIVGGGYITGHPLEASRVYDIARISRTPVLGVNYRKSTHPGNAFPAALQDTLAAYAYLLRKGYTRIAVAGDSAGAGLGLALMQYLARLSEKPTRDTPDQLIMPVRACFYSPWADLTFSHPYNETVHFDIIHPTMLRVAAAAYTHSIQGSLSSAPNNIRGRMSRSHPFFSPALKSSVASLRRIKQVAEKANQSAPSFLVFYGGAELFSAECASLCENLREAGLEVEEYMEKDETHGFLLVPTFMSAKVEPALIRMGSFLGS